MRVLSEHVVGTTEAQLWNKWNIVIRVLGVLAGFSEDILASLCLFGIAAEAAVRNRTPCPAT